MSTIQVLVTGANGQLGNECKQLASSMPNAKFYFTDIEELSITDASAIEHIFASNHFNFCINAAAYTAVDQAETDQEKAMAINATAVGYLASACQKYNCRLIHVSTDYVFDGEKDSGYNEDDSTGPTNVYGITKLEGERLAIQNNPMSVIIRTSWVYSYFGKNFVKTMMKLMQERTEISVVSDQIGKPTYAADLAAAIFAIMQKSDSVPAGIYHFSNQGVISWHDFATAIQQIGGYECLVHPIPSSAYPVPAKRPNYSILNTHKIETIVGITPPFWRDSLEKCMQLLNA